MNEVTNSIQSVINMTWPMVFISIVIIVSLRVVYLVKNHEHLTLYKELLSLSFIIYILCLFQVVTFQDDVSWSTNNFIPFKEMLRYSFGSRLFIKNVLGNMLLFLPFGMFTAYILKSDKPYLPLILTVIASFSIELVQMSIGRVFDVDDIILNILGSLIGYGIYYVLCRLTERLPKVLKSEWFLNIISIIVLIGVITLI